MAEVKRIRNSVKKKRNRQRRQLIGLLTALCMLFTVCGLIFPAGAAEEAEVPEVPAAEAPAETVQPAAETVEPVVQEQQVPAAEPLEAETVDPEPAPEPNTDQDGEDIDPAAEESGTVEEDSDSESENAGSNENTDNENEDPDAGSVNVDAGDEGADNGSENTDTDAEEEEDENAAAMAVSPLRYETEQFTAEAHFRESAGFAAGTGFLVREYPAGSAEYESYRAAVNTLLQENGIGPEEAEKKVGTLRLYEAVFTDKEGARIRPADTIDIEIRYKNADIAEAGGTAGVLTFRTNDEETVKAVFAVVGGDGAPAVEKNGGIINGFRVKAFAAQDPHVNQVIGLLEYTADSDEASEKETEEADAAGEAGDRIVKVSGAEYSLRVQYGEDAGIPADARFEAVQLTEDHEEYEEYKQRTLDAVGEKDTALLGLFDLTIYDAEDNVIHPSAPVTVSVNYGDLVEENADVFAVHFIDSSAAEVPSEEETVPAAEAEVEVLETECADGAAVFETDGFSVYGIAYTVDFFYEIDGNSYRFSMKGADTVSLRALAEALHVYEKAGTDETEEAEETEPIEEITEEITCEELPEDAETAGNEALDRFMTDVKSVTCSDPELLFPAKVEEDATAGEIKRELKLFPSYPLGLKQHEVLELNAKEYRAGDWILISMKAFDTAETLTVEMTTGETFTIAVTDAQDAQMIGDYVQTISNPAGTTIDLFDYWIISQDLVGRDGWGDLDQGWGGHGDEKGLNGTGNNKGINSGANGDNGHALKFSPAWEGTVYNGTKVGTTGSSWNSLNADGRNGLNSYTGSGNPFPGLVQGTLINGFPTLTVNDTIGTNGESLAYLFDPGIAHAGKASYPSVDQLLYVDRDGYYTYDSRDYRADFSGGTFVLTEQVEEGSARGFWPFGTSKFWNGLHINTQFSMPANGQVLNPRGEYKDMQFEFSGDDDTWLYIDGVLVGDAGGVHNRTEIDVNFAKGTVTVTGGNAGGHSGDYLSVQYLDDLFIAAGKYNEADWEDIGDDSGHKRFKAGTYHVFDMFYLERGGDESNLCIHYNLVSTADFTAHKSYEGYDDDDILLRNQFRFELTGLDGKYRSVWSDEAQDYVLVKEDDTSPAIMPHASGTGAGTVVSPYYNGNASTEMSNGTVVGSQIYITGNTEDGNVNFGHADISEQDMHDCDEGNPPVYRYIVQEIVPDDAVNGDGITWAEATPAQRAAGGFVKDSIIYDGTIYYMTARVTSWTETDATGREFIRYGLSKTYYTDDTYTTKKTDMAFIDFRNRYTPDYADLDFDKINVNEEPVEGAVFQLFRDSACKIPAKGEDSQNVTAVSDSQGKVSFTNVRTGIYFLKEISVPEPYEVNPTVYRATISRQGSSMCVNTDQGNTPVVEVINIKPGDLNVIKKWQDADGKEVSGEGYPATVQLRRYHYVRTGPEPETHNVMVYFHFPDSGWNTPLMEYGPYEITGNSVNIHWTCDGCNFYRDSARTQMIPKTGNDCLVQIEDFHQDLELHFYGQYDWGSQNMRAVSVDGAYDDSKELRIDESFPSVSERAIATQVLTDERHMHAWSIGAGDEYDFPAVNDVGDYLYYIVELDEDGNEVAIDGDAGNGMTLVSIKYNPERTEGCGITHGIVTVTNKLPEPQSIDVVIKKTDDEEDSTNYLAGAVFKLEYRTNPSGEWRAAKDIEGLDIPELNTNSRFTVPKTGITLTGLINGQYRLEEITPPSGYMIRAQYPVTFTVANGNITSIEGTISEVRYTAAVDTADAEFIVPNSPGPELPSTGGRGTLLFSLGGIFLIMTAALMYVFRTRRRERRLK